MALIKARSLSYRVFVASVLTIPIACGLGRGRPPGSDAAASREPSLDGGAGDGGQSGDAAAAKSAASVLSTVELQSFIFAEPAPDAAKIGYLRVGAALERSTEKVEGVGCAGGWYAVQPRGFVCAGREGVTLDMSHQAVVIARSLPPKRTLPLPYTYGTSWGAPFYVRLPTREDIRNVEGNVSVKTEVLSRLRSKLSERKRWPEPPVPSNGPPEPLGSGGALENLAGIKLSKHALVAARSWPGMRVSFLGAFAHEERAYFITTEHLIVPVDRMRIAKLAEFHGIELTEADKDGVHLPVVWPAWKPARLWQMSNAGKRGAHPTELQLLVQQSAEVSETEIVLGNERYYEVLHLPEGGEEGARYLVRTKQVSRAIKVLELPQGVSEADEWIDVSIQKQVLTLYRGKEPVFTTLVSTGVDGAQNPETTKSTVRGLFRIKMKHISARMKAEEQPAAEGNDKPDPRYRIDDVPYVQFFERSYALHGAFWHDAFGQPKSHGCINLSPRDARYLFEHTSPRVPQTWHGAAATNEEPGTFVYIHAD
jgi:hypothetical protein